MALITLVTIACGQLVPRLGQQVTFRPRGVVLSQEEDQLGTTPAAYAYLGSAVRDGC